VVPSAPPPHNPTPEELSAAWGLDADLAKQDKYPLPAYVARDEAFKHYYDRLKSDLTEEEEYETDGEEEGSRVTRSRSKALEGKIAKKRKEKERSVDPNDEPLVGPPQYAQYVGPMHSWLEITPQIDLCFRNNVDSVPTLS